MNPASTAGRKFVQLVSSYNLKKGCNWILFLQNKETLTLTLTNPWDLKECSNPPKKKVDFES